MQARIMKTVAAHLSADVQDDLKRWRFRRQIQRGDFIPNDEPEIQFISTILKPGDHVIDVGANIGHYTLHMSQLVGPTGRVYAFEPIPQTFALLSANVSATGNVTLINMAASCTTQEVEMSLPKFDTGLNNYYRASISEAGEYKVRCMPLDDLVTPRIALIKIDAEDHDFEVLHGATQLIAKHSPAIVVEIDKDNEIEPWLKTIGYQTRRIGDSPNLIATRGA